AQRGEFPAVLFRPEPRRAPMRSIGARQGVFCFGAFYLGKQIKDTRTAVRNLSSNKNLALIENSRLEPRSTKAFAAIRP
ncbi:hypothetical protein, partial [Salinisphaera sp.]|uniref:hypothetical protein n=1 Tax=Salinisphaera sp. TaxID=1914330 RepID=UPI0025CBA895